MSRVPFFVPVGIGLIDQLISYPTFLHVSYKRTGDNRHQRLKKGGAGYELD